MITQITLASSFQYHAIYALLYYTCIYMKDIWCLSYQSGIIVKAGVHQPVARPTEVMQLGIVIVVSTLKLFQNNCE